MRRAVHRRVRRPAVVLALAACGLVAATTHAQEVFDPVTELAEEAPEAWALRFFTSVSSFHGLGPVRRAAPWSWSLGGEVLQVPHLDAEQRRVGFGGRKEEPLDRTPVWGRLRVGLGLPGGLAAEVGWVPPVEIDGIEADLWALALQGPLVELDRWSLGWRLYLQRGEAGGDFTCTAGEAALEPGAPGNAFGCEAASSDTVTLDHEGVELTSSWFVGATRRASLFVAAAYQRNDLAFQVDARTFGFIDRSLLLSDDSTTTLSAGVEWRPAERWSGSLGVQYVPLEVRRLDDVSPRDDDLVAARALLRYRFDGRR